MYQWKKENLELLKEQKVVVPDGELIFEPENNLTREEKLEFINSFPDTMLLSKIDYYTRAELKEENVSLYEYIKYLHESYVTDIKNAANRVFYGKPSAGALQSWLERRDTYRIVMSPSNICFLGSIRDITDDPLHKKSNDDYYDDLIDEGFHRLLRECYLNESKYEVQFDNKNLLRQYIRRGIVRWGPLGQRLWFDEVGRILLGTREHYRVLTTKELIYYGLQYQRLELFHKEVCIQTNDFYLGKYEKKSDLLTYN